MTTFAQLVATWRAKAAEHAPFNPPVALAFQVCARMLEQTTGGAADVGEVFVVDALRTESGLSTKELRHRAAVAGVSTTSVSRALVLLEAQGIIGYDVAARNRKRWHLSDHDRSDRSVRGETPEKSESEPVQNLSDRLDGASTQESLETRHVL